MKTIEELKKLIQAGEEAKRELESLRKMNFRNKEVIIRYSDGEPFNYFDTAHFDNDRFRKLTLEELILSMAPPEAVRWEMEDRCDVLFFNENGTLVDGMSFPHHMARDDWESCGGPL